MKIIKIFLLSLFFITASQAQLENFLTCTTLSDSGECILGSPISTTPVWDMLRDHAVVTDSVIASLQKYGKSAGNYVDIESGVADIPSGGGMMVLEPSTTYTLNDSLTVSNNLILSGRGFSSIIKGTEAVVISAISDTNVVIKNLKVMTDSVDNILLRFQNCKSVIVTGNIFSGGRYPIWISGTTSNVIIKNNDFSGCDSIFIYLDSGVSNIIIEDNIGLPTVYRPYKHEQSSIAFPKIIFDFDTKTTEAEFDSVRMLGFNIIHTYDWETWTDNERAKFLQLAEKYNLKVLPQILNTAIGSLGTFIKTWKDYKAIWGWYAFEEPSGSAATLEARYDTVKVYDQIHPVVGLYNNSSLLSSSFTDDAYDIYMHDEYPFDGGYARDEEMVKDRFNNYYKTTSKEKPRIPVLEAFYQGVNQDPTGTLKTTFKWAQEMGFSDGIGYFNWDNSSFTKDLKRDQTLRNEVKDILKNFNANPIVGKDYSYYSEYNTFFETNTSNIFRNGGFNDWYSGDDNAPDFWELVGTPSSIIQSSDNPFDGNNTNTPSVLFVSDAANEGIRTNSNDYFAFEDSSIYSINFWYKVGTSDTLLFTRAIKTDIWYFLSEEELVSTTWKRITAIHSATTTNDDVQLGVRFLAKNSGDSVYVSLVNMNLGHMPAKWTPHVRDNIGKIGNDSFTTTATKDTVLLRGLTTSQEIFLTPKGSSISENDVLSGEVKTDTLIVHRSSTQVKKNKYFDAGAFLQPILGAATRDTTAFGSGAAEDEFFSFDNSADDSLEIKWIPEHQGVTITIDSVWIMCSTTSTAGDSVGWVFNSRVVDIDSTISNELLPSTEKSKQLDLGASANKLLAGKINAQGAFVTANHPAHYYIRLKRDTSISNNVAAAVRFHGMFIFYRVTLSGTSGLTYSYEVKKI